MDKDLSKNLDFFREKNDLDEVIKILLNKKKDNPKNLDLIFQLAGAYRSLGNFDAALLNYDEILSYDETYTAAYRMIGTIINHKKKWKIFRKNRKNKRKK